MTLSLAVAYETDLRLVDAQALSSRLNLPLIQNHFPQLCFTEQKLVLKTKDFSPLYADFELAPLLKRIQAGKNQGLIKACKPKKGLRVLDLTAGWGRDASILAYLGADVLMLERNPYMHALLVDGLERLTSDIKLSVLFVEACDYLTTLEASLYPDVILIDPMHPKRQKSALVKKEMQILQDLLGPQEDSAQLIECAKEKAARIVVKWPAKLPAITKPDFTIPGKTVRFDVYIRN